MEATLMELATQIARQQAQLQWQLWASAAVLAVVCIFVAVYLRSYSSKVADIKAQTDKLPEIKHILAETTHITEQIKAEVGQKDWRERERLTLFRERLEEFVGAIYEVQAETARRSSAIISEETLSTEQKATHRLLAIASLYFRPHLRLDTLKVQSAAIKFGKDAYKANHDWRMYTLKMNGELSPEIRAALTAEYQALKDADAQAVGAAHKELLESCVVLEGKALDMIGKYVP